MSTRTAQPTSCPSHIPFPPRPSPEPSTGLLELLRGLTGMHVRWRTLSAPARASLEALVCEYLTRAARVAASDARGRAALTALVLAMGHFKVPSSVIAPFSPPWHTLTALTCTCRCGHLFSLFFCRFCQVAFLDYSAFFFFFF